MVTSISVLGFVHRRFLPKAHCTNSCSEKMVPWITQKEVCPFTVSHLEKPKDLRPKFSVKKEISMDDITTFSNLIVKLLLSETEE